MTNQEFSNQFDVLYNNVMSNQAPGLDEYEKSVFLTKAQNEIVLSYFNPRGNKLSEGFDDNPRRQVDFSMLMRTYTATPSANPLFYPNSNGAKSVSVPTDVLVYINESLTVTRNTTTAYLTVVPISFDEYHRQMAKPYKRPPHYQAWRLLNATESSANNTTTVTASADLIAAPNDTFGSYVARYVKRPRAIVLAGVTDSGVTVGGTDSEQTCELDPVIHEDILQRAVELAKAAYTGDLNSQIALGTSSMTDKGIALQQRTR